MKKLASFVLVIILALSMVAFADTSDLELIKAQGHPTYYGNAESAHEVWNDTSNTKIIYPDSNYRYKSGKTIILMESYRGDIILDVEIYFMNCQPAVNVDLNSALDIAKTYLPLDILSEYYEFYESYFLPKGSGEEGIYAVRYHLTDAAKAGYYADEHDYAGQMHILLYANDNGYIDYFDIGSQMPNGTTPTAEAVEWHFDFME